jgi:cyclic pyranopterin phosphate synthase
MLSGDFGKPRSVHYNVFNEMSSSVLIDSRNRPLRDLRISVTDRCNYRCTYCMPLARYEWIERREILTFEEIAHLASLFVDLGVYKIRLTGGEPLLRKGLEKLVGKLSGLTGLDELCLTTNGDRLSEKAAALKDAGLHRVNVSVDSLQPEKFHRITQRGDLKRVLDGLSAAQKSGLQPVKINTVIVRGVNDNEILDLVEFSRKHGFAIRFIEYMDVGNANQWKSDRMVSREEILAIIQGRYALVPNGRSTESAPAQDYRFADGTGDLGVIASVTEPFCGACNRARLTADGHLVTCLYSTSGHDMKALLRGGAGDDRLREVIRGIWNQRIDRYSEERLDALQSDRGYAPQSRKKIEMIRLGG